MDKRLRRHFIKENIQLVNTWVKRYFSSLVSRRIAIKTTRSYHYTTTRMTEMRKTENTRCWWGLRTTRTGRSTNQYNRFGKPTISTEAKHTQVLSITAQNSKPSKSPRTVELINYGIFTQWIALQQWAWIIYNYYYMEQCKWLSQV